MKLYELWRTLPFGIVIHLEDTYGKLETIDEDTRVLPHRYRDCDVYHVSPTSSVELTVKIFPPEEHASLAPSSDAQWMSINPPDEA